MNIHCSMIHIRDNNNEPSSSFCATGGETSIERYLKLQREEASPMERYNNESAGSIRSSVTLGSSTVSSRKSLSNLLSIQEQSGQSSTTSSKKNDMHWASPRTSNNAPRVDSVPFSPFSQASLSSRGEVSSVFSTQLSTEQQAKLRELQMPVGATSASSTTIAPKLSPASYNDTRRSSSSSRNDNIAQFLSSSHSLPCVKQNSRHIRELHPLLSLALGEIDLVGSSSLLADTAPALPERTTTRSLLPFGYKVKSANGLLDGLVSPSLKRTTQKEKYEPRNKSSPSLLMLNSRWNTSGSTEDLAKHQLQEKKNHRQHHKEHTARRLENAPLSDDQLAAMKALLLGDNKNAGPPRMSRNSRTTTKNDKLRGMNRSTPDLRPSSTSSSALNIMLDTKGSRWEATTPDFVTDRKKQLSPTAPPIGGGVGGRRNHRSGGPLPKKLDLSPSLQGGVKGRAMNNTRQWESGAPPRSLSPKSDLSLLVLQKQQGNRAMMSPGSSAGRWHGGGAASSCCSRCSGPPATPGRKTSMQSPKSCPSLLLQDFNSLRAEESPPPSIRSRQGYSRGSLNSLDSILSSPGAVALNALMKGQDDKSTSVKMMRQGKQGGSQATTTSSSSLGQLRRSGQSLASMSRKNNHESEEEDSHPSRGHNSDWDKKPLQGVLPGSPPLTHHKTKPSSSSSSSTKKKNMFDDIINWKLDRATNTTTRSIHLSSSSSRGASGSAGSISSRTVLSKAAMMYFEDEDEEEEVVSPNNNKKMSMPVLVVTPMMLKALRSPGMKMTRTNNNHHHHLEDHEDDDFMHQLMDAAPADGSCRRPLKKCDLQQMLLSARRTKSQNDIMLEQDS